MVGEVSGKVLSGEPQVSRHRHRKRTERRTAAMRRWRLVFIAAVLIPVITAAVMITQHGVSFFVFRSAGTGESPDFDGSLALSENQGPGQPDAPRPLLVVAITAAGVRMTLSGTGHPAWAGIAELRHGGKWVILASGQQFASVVADAAGKWNSSPGQYMSQWIVLPVVKS